MVDETYNVRRFVAEYSETTDELLAEHELETFNLKQFQAEFDANNDDPMFYCYSITASKADFIEKYLRKKIEWEFTLKAYFLEAEAVNSDC